MPFRMGPLEIIIILVIVLLIFGVGKLPQVGDALGKGIRAFRKGQSGEDEEKGEVKGEEEAPKVEKVADTEVTEAKAEVTEAKAEEKKEEKSGESA